MRTVIATGYGLKPCWTHMGFCEILTCGKSLNTLIVGKADMHRVHYYGHPTPSFHLREHRATSTSSDFIACLFCPSWCYPLQRLFRAFILPEITMGRRKEKNPHLDAAYYEGLYADEEPNRLCFESLRHLGNQ